MRTFEILILATILLRLIILFFRPSKRRLWMDWVPSLAMLLILIHFVLEGYRWQMEFAYVLAGLLFILSLPRIMPSACTVARPPSRKWRAFGIVGTVLGILCFSYAIELAPPGQIVPAYGLALLLLVLSVPQIRPGTRTAAKPPSRKRRAFRIVGVVLGLLFLMYAAGLPAVLPVFRLPEPTGQYPVGTMYLHVVDRTRPETFTPDESDCRELMIQVWYPAQPQSGAKRAPYLENANLASPVLAEFAQAFSPTSRRLPSCIVEHLSLVQTHAYLDAPISSAQSSYPVLLFSHGYLSLLGQNTVLMEELASHGYIIFSVGHTYEDAVTVFPDGRIIPADSTQLEYSAVKKPGWVLNFSVRLRTWIDDMHFVMDELQTINTGQGDSIFAGKLDMARLGVFGMSFGGQTAFETFAADDRCKAGISLDGGGAIQRRLSKPFFFFFSEENRGDVPLYLGAGDLGHVALVEGTTHIDFMDFSLFSPVLKLGFLRRIGGQRMCGILNAYTLAFFDKYLKGKDVHPLDGPSPAYPEVKFPSSTTEDVIVTKYLTVLSKKQAIDDLDYLTEKIKTKHPNPFKHITEREFDLQLQKTKTGLPEEINRKDFALLIAELLALIGDWCTTLKDFPDFGTFIHSGGKIFPLRLRYENDGMTVISWPKEIKPQHLKAGDRLIAINGTPMKSLLKRYHKYISGQTEEQKNWMLEKRLPELIWLTEGVSESFKLTLMDSKDHKYTEIISAVAGGPSRNRTTSKTGELFTYEFYLDGKVCLFKAKAFWLSRFIDYNERLASCIHQMKQKDTSVFIFDLRGYGGGDWRFTWELLSRTVPKPIKNWQDTIKPKRDTWEGHLVLLCDRWTQSVYPAVIVKDSNVGIIAGEETGGRACSRDRVGSYRLPNSGLCCRLLLFTNKYYKRPAGFDDGRGVLSDLPLDVTLEDNILVEKIYDHVKKMSRSATDRAN
ncbi:MAG: hypothetical protein ACETWQ_01650 [Phycisphaerae bacterium]